MTMKKPYRFSVATFLSIGGSLRYCRLDRYDGGLDSVMDGVLSIIEDEPTKGSITISFSEMTEEEFAKADK